MPRVSTNSSHATINFSVNQAKRKLEDLQMKGTSLKRMTKPSDDPTGNMELMTIRSRNKNIDQYTRNMGIAKASLEFVDESLKDLVDIVGKAKEIAVVQSSSLYGPDIREGVAQEVQQLRNQAISIANRRFNNKYLFGGFHTDTQPVSIDGVYHGDSGVTSVEIMHNVFVPTNIPGDELFYPVPKPQMTTNRENLFAQLELLSSALLSDEPKVIQGLLERFDFMQEKLVTHRTRVGSILNVVNGSEQTIENEKLFNATLKNQIEDADIGEIYSDLAKQNQVLQAVYKSSSNLLNDGLIQFIK